MINIDTILSTFDKQGTLLKWLQKLEQALSAATLENVIVNTIAADIITLTFNFADGTSITTPQITLPQGPQGETGATPDISITATVDDETGVPEVSVEKTGTAEAPQFAIGFKNLKGATGNTGPQGETGQGFNFMGTWVTDNEYREYDVVTYTADGTTVAFVCINDVSGSDTPPPADTTNWQVFASGGSDSSSGKYLHSIRFNFIVMDTTSEIKIYFSFVSSHEDPYTNITDVINDMYDEGFTGTAYYLPANGTYYNSELNALCRIEAINYASTVLYVALGVTNVSISGSIYNTTFQVSEMDIITLRDVVQKL